MNPEQRSAFAETMTQDQKEKSKGPISFFREKIIKPASAIIAIESSMLAGSFQEKAYADQEVKKEVSMLQNIKKEHKLLKNGDEIFYIVADMETQAAEDINKEYKQPIDTKIKGVSMSVKEQGDPKIEGDELTVREFFLTFLDKGEKPKRIASRLSYEGVIQGINPYKGKSITAKMLKSRDSYIEKQKLANSLNYLRMKIKILNAFYALEQQNTPEALAVKQDILALIKKTKEQYGDESVNAAKVISKLESLDEAARKRVEQKHQSQ